MTDNEGFHLSLSGPNSDYISRETIRFLGKLLSFFMYNEIDKAASSLLKFTNPFDIETVKQAAYKLYLLCDVIKEE